RWLAADNTPLAAPDAGRDRRTNQGPAECSKSDQHMKTDAYEAIKGRFLSREWRLDNLYFIQNERGEVVRFVRNESQRAFWDNAWYLNAILKARQLGFSTQRPAVPRRHAGTPPRKPGR